MTERQHTVNLYAIVREPGSAARRSGGGWARPKRMATVAGYNQRSALAEYAQQRLASRNRQVSDHRYEWRGSRSEGDWRPDDGEVKGGRTWRLVVTLANGANVHDAVFYAWKTA